MKISVIVPVHNAETYLRECIESILAQSYTDTEIILVDDGSTDSSGAICDEYASKNKSISVIHQANAGPGAARNAGIDRATGDYIAFVDSDDVIHPTLLAQLMRHIKPEDIATTTHIRARHNKWHEGEEVHVNTYEVDEAIEQTLYQRGLNASVCGKLFPRSIFRNLRFAEDLYYEDLDICYRLLDRCRGQIVSVEMPYYFYRDNPTSFINTFSRRRLDVLKVVDRMEKYFAGRAHLLKAAKDRKFSANCNMMILCSQNGLKETADGCWEVIKKYRKSSLTNPKVRIKNRLGALVSYLGKAPMLLCAKIF